MKAEALLRSGAEAEFERTERCLDTEHENFSNDFKELMKDLYSLRAAR